PGGLERNNEYINRHLPDLKTMKKISENEEVTTLSSNEKQKIDVDLKIKTEADPEKSNSYKVFKDKYKMVVEARNDTKEALAMKEEKAPSVAPPSL
ncbi:MAG: hypothetical protein PSV35_06430, partial [bacterium]|nr:hypothetical protein [bacterium]